MTVQGAGEDFVTHPHNQIPFFSREHTSLTIGTGGRLLYDGKLAYDSHRHPDIPYLEILQRTLGLRPPKFFRRHFNRPYGITLCPGLHNNL